MTPDEIMRELERHDVFPKAAMNAAREDRVAIIPIFLQLVERLGKQDLSEMAEGDITALIPAFHLLGEFRETGAYRPLLQLMRQPPDTLDHLLGDAVTETSFRVIAATFDGDLQPLFAFIQDADADVFARSSMFDALILIAQIHPSKRSSIEDYFRKFRQLCRDDNEDVLVGWLDGLVDLALVDMAPEIRATFEADLIPKDYCTLEDILRDLNVSAESDGQPLNPRYRLGMITDAVTELSKWHGYSSAYLAKQKKKKALSATRAMPWAETFMHGSQSAGRNDPCPCGSGKKFKKCCLH